MVSIAQAPSSRGSPWAAAAQPLLHGDQGQRRIGRDAFGKAGARAIRSWWAVTSRTSPMRAASSASIGSPVNSSSAALAGPTSCGSIEAADIADQAALDEQLGEDRLLGGDADVGIERQLHPPAHRRPVHRGDHRLVALDHRHGRRRRLERGHRAGAAAAGGLAGHHLLARRRRSRRPDRRR